MAVKTFRCRWGKSTKWFFAKWILPGGGGGGGGIRCGTGTECINPETKKLKCISHRNFSSPFRAMLNFLKCKFGLI